MSISVPAEPEIRPRETNVVGHPAALGALPVRRARVPWLGIASGTLLVLAPLLAIAWYLFQIAEDRFASRAAFSIRSNDMTAPVEIFGAVTQLGASSSAADGQILYDYIRSQPMLRRAEAELDLVAMFNRAPGDWLYTLGTDRPIEDRLRHWRRMVDISIDSSSGILTVEARTHVAEDARSIVSVILAASSDLVNRLSETARTDAVRHAEDDLSKAEARLRRIRADLRAFRDLEQDVDPTQNAQAALGLVTSLEGEMARAQVRLESLSDVLAPDAPRLRTLRREIATLEERIEQERTRLGSGARVEGGETRSLSEVVGDYEELLVDREFAEQAYTLALTTLEQAQAEARRQHRYLAVHIEPTLSEEADYPDRPILLAAAAAMLIALWAIFMLVTTNIRERA
ncbi:MAG: sugar transporter [Pseudomonadota bacterium]